MLNLLVKIPYIFIWHVERLIFVDRRSLCEAHISPFATARRAWLFADTPKGAVANAVLYTLVETARSNELNVYEYLKYLLSVMLDTDFNNHPKLLEAYLPWSKELPEECRLIQERKKCLN